MADNKIGTVAYPIAPTVEKLRSTLLDVASVDNGRFAGLDGIGLFQSWNCLEFQGVPVFCGANSKDLSQGAGWVDGVRFGAYGGVTCKMVDMDEQAAGALAAFERGESTAVERGLMALRFPVNAVGSGLPGSWAAAPDINAAGAVLPSVGIALLEEYLGNIYTGSPTIHLPLSIASLMGQQKKIEFEGDVLRTPLGSKVAAGVGYANPNSSPAGVAAAAGERWIYATGQVWLGRSEIINRTAFNEATNEVVTLIERGYVAAIDCDAIAAIRVTVTG